MRCNNPTSLPFHLHCLAFGGLVVVTSILAWTTQGMDATFWSGWPESKELRRPAYSERVDVDAFFRTRANVWSNLAYVLVGFYALALGWHDLRHRDSNVDSYLLRTPGLSLAFGLACCYLGIGSGLFHASLTRFGQQLDVAAMYPPLMVLIAIGIGRWIPKLHVGQANAVSTWPVFLVLVVLASWYLFLYKWSMSSTTVLATLIATVLLCCIHDHLRRNPKLDERWLIASFAGLVFGVACRQLDVAGRFTGPDAWLQGHAFWHALTSVSLACMYFYYRSEKRSQN